MNVIYVNSSVVGYSYFTEWNIIIFKQTTSRYLYNDLECHVKKQIIAHLYE